MAAAGTAAGDLSTICLTDQYTVRGWRIDQLTRAGWPLDLACLLAERDDIDLHQACDLVGPAGVNQALKILL